MMEKFTIRTFRSGNWYVAECLELPGCVSQGRTRTSALRNIAEAIGLYLEVAAENRQPAKAADIGELAVTA